MSEPEAIKIHTFNGFCEQTYSKVRYQKNQNMTSLVLTRVITENLISKTNFNLVNDFTTVSNFSLLS